MRSSAGLAPFGFSGAQVGTAGGIGNAVPDTFGALGSAFPPANIPTAVAGLSPLSEVDVSNLGMGGARDSSNPGAYGASGSTTTATPDTFTLDPNLYKPTTDLLDTLYRSDLGREADVSGLNYYGKQLAGGLMDLSGINNALKASAEGQAWQAQNPTSQGFAPTAVDDLYAVRLGRAADSAGRDYWQRQIDADTPLAQVAGQIAGTSEGQSYAANLGRSPYAFTQADASLGPGPIANGSFGDIFYNPNQGSTVGAYGFSGTGMGTYPSGSPSTVGYEGAPITGSVNGFTSSLSPLSTPTLSDPFSSAGLNGSLPAYQPLDAGPTNVGPMAFGNVNVSQGLGAVGNGSFSNFDPSWYLQNNGDVAAAAQASGRDQSAFALDHFINEGIKEGRALGPNEWFTGGFDPSGYLTANPDVAAAGANPLQHYLTSGIGEGRSPGGASASDMVLSRYQPGTGNLRPSEQALNVQAASGQIAQGIGLSNQIAQTNANTAGQYATPLADALLGDASSPMGRATNQIAMQNAQEAAAMRVPAAPIIGAPVQTSFYGALPTANSGRLLGGALPPGAGFI